MRLVYWCWSLALASVTLGSLAEELEAKVNVGDLRLKAEHLFHIASLSNNTRAIGSIGHEGTLHYITRLLREHQGFYDISSQTFNVTFNSIRDYQVSVDGQAVNASALYYSPATGNVTARAVAVELGCEENDYIDIDIKGCLAVAQRGGCTFERKAQLAKSFDAAGLVIYNSVPGEGLKGTLTRGNGEVGGLVPTFGMSLEDGLKLVNSVSEVSLFMDSAFEKIVTRNIIVETKTGDHDNIILLGSHLDSVEAGPGINDNGSGSITLLHLAQTLAENNIQTENSIRLIWFSAEEVGLIGSSFYANSLTEKENLKIRLMLDYDMLALPNYAFEIYEGDDLVDPVGSQQIKNKYSEWYALHGFNYTFIPMDGRLDYVGFAQQSIPVGGIATGAEKLKLYEEMEMFGGVANESFDQCYHQACDNLQNLNYNAWETNSKLIFNTLGSYAESLNGFPARHLVATKSLADFRYIYRGDELFI